MDILQNPRKSNQAKYIKKLKSKSPAAFCSPEKLDFFTYEVRFLDYRYIKFLKHTSVMNYIIDTY